MARKRPEEFDELVIGNQNLPKNKIIKKIKKGDVLKYFISKVSNFSNSGAYISCSEDYIGQKVFVIILKEKIK